MLYDENFLSTKYLNILKKAGPQIPRWLPGGHQPQKATKKPKTTWDQSLITVPSTSGPDLVANPVMLSVVVMDVRGNNHSTNHTLLDLVQVH